MFCIFRIVLALFWIFPGRAEVLQWETGRGFRSAPVPVAEPGGDAGFQLMAGIQTGIQFTNLISERRHLTNQILLNGSGVAAGDVDGDGLVDLYFCGLDSNNVLYRNLGDWRFEDITERAGVACAGLDSTGAAFADLNGNGRLDLIVNSNGGGTHIFINQGEGRFEPLTRLNQGKGGMSVAVADYDGDGYLDLYIVNYRTSGLMDMPNARATFRTVGGRTMVDRINGRPLTDPDLTNRFVFSAERGIEELGEMDVLYRNLGGTNFVAVPFTGGAFLDEEGNRLAEAPLDWGLAAMFRDLNGNGRPDLYVCNDFHAPDRLWINEGGGRFRALPHEAIRKWSFFSMAVDFADINRDGYDDFMVLDMLSRDHRQRMRQIGERNASMIGMHEIEHRPQVGMNTLFLNRGDLTWTEIGQLSGLDATEWAWGVMFLDVDLDGWEDVLVANGQERAARDADIVERLRAMRAARPMSDADIFRARRLFPRLATPNLAFRNRGDLTFEEQGTRWGFDHKGVSHGMIVADLDNDGDLDVVVNNLNEAPSIYRNETSAPRVAIRLRGDSPNTRGIGARLTLTGGAVPVQTQEMIAGGRYLSGDDPVRTFAAGSVTNVMRLEIRWPGGRVSRVEEVRANRIYEVFESDSDLGSRTPLPQPPPFFEDVSARLGHRHQSEPFNDFELQALLPRRLSHDGPGVVWTDLNGNGWDDLVVGAGRSDSMAAWLNDQRGGFQRWNGAPFGGISARAQAGIAAVGPVLAAALSNYEDGLASGPGVRGLDALEKSIQEILPAGPSAYGPVAMADLNRNGSLELFVGGRVLPGRYPEAASSVILRQESGRWTTDAANTRALERVGLVNGAVWSDLNGDGWPDLILACEWGPVRVFLNEQGRLADRTEQLGLAAYRGWWTSVATGDFDGDGQLDIVAGNWGRNTPFESYRSQPLRLYHADFNGDGRVDIVEAYHAPEIGKYVPWRNRTDLARAMPDLPERYPTHAAYGEAGVEEILGPYLARAQILEVNWLESSLFLNRAGRFEPKPLPIKAQFAPSFAVAVADLDGDGHEDVFLSQNFFGVHEEVPRYDGGRGLWLRGDGSGGFMPVPGQESGIRIYGEQRGAAFGDFDGDGRVDLVVAQHGSATRLFRNAGARPGLRVRLKSDQENQGIGAKIQMHENGKSGPIREVQAGSGYWSQNSLVQILAQPAGEAEIQVEWPDGERTRAPVPAGALEIEVRPDGSVSVLRP